MKQRQTGRSKGGRNGQCLTKEPGNLTAINKFKWSGIANEKTVDISPGAEKGIVLTTKSRKSKRINKVRDSLPFRQDDCVSLLLARPKALSCTLAVCCLMMPYRLAAQQALQLPRALQQPQIDRLHDRG